MIDAHELSGKAPNVTLSVIMPTKNSGSYLRQAVDSIINQDIEDWELIVVDDNSTDGSAQAIRGLHPRVEVVHSPGTGIADALNYGISKSRGQYIARLDADDVATPSRLKHQLAYMEDHPGVSMLGGQITRVDEHLRPLSISHLPLAHDDIVADLLAGRHAIAHTTVIWPSSLGLRYESRPAEDWAIFLKASLLGQLRNLPEALVNYRFHGSSVNSTALYKHRHDMYRVVQRHKGAVEAHGWLVNMRIRREVIALSAYRRAMGSRRVIRITHLCVAAALHPSAALRRATQQIKGVMRYSRH